MCALFSILLLRKKSVDQRCTTGRTQLLPCALHTQFWPTSEALLTPHSNPPQCSQKQAIAALHSHLDPPLDAIAEICREATVATGELADAVCPEGCLEGSSTAEDTMRSVQQLAATELEESFMARFRQLALSVSRLCMMSQRRPPMCCA